MVDIIVSGAWNAQLYANRALDHLKARKGFIRSTNSSYAQEYGRFRKGQVIAIKQPQIITVRDETSLTMDELDPPSIQLSLDYYRHASFNTEDWDLAVAGQEMFDLAVAPAVDRLAEAVEVVCLGLAYQHVGNYHVPSSTIAVSDVTTPQRILMDSRCPVDDEANMHFVVSPALNEGLLLLSAFTQNQGSGQQGVADQKTGQLTRRFGFGFSPTQLVPTYTAPGTSLNDLIVAVVGDTALHATTITFDETTLTGIVNPGMVFTIAGDTTKYSVTNTVTASGNALTGVTFSPPLRVAAANNAVATFIADSVFTTKKQSLAYHSNAFAFVAAPLGRAQQHAASADIGVATDPDSGLSLRVIMGYDMATRKSMCVIDTLFGFKSTQPEYACRVMA